MIPGPNCELGPRTRWLKPVPQGGAVRRILLFQNWVQLVDLISSLDFNPSTVNPMRFFSQVNSFEKRQTCWQIAMIPRKKTCCIIVWIPYYL